MYFCEYYFIFFFYDNNNVVLSWITCKNTVPYLLIETSKNANFIYLLKNYNDDANVILDGYFISSINLSIWSLL